MNRERDVILWFLFIAGVLILLSEINIYATSDTQLCKRSLIESGEAFWRFPHHTNRETAKWCARHRDDWRVIVWPRTLRQAQIK